METYRDYSLTGADGQAAIKNGLAGGTWYASPISRQEMKQFITRRDGPALRDTAIWLAILASSGVMMIQTWGTWWFLPFFLIYSVFYGSCGDSRWHECGHGTAFKTPWMNRIIYHLASFLILRNGSLWRWSHTRHHTDTLIVGRDPEIAVMRPPSFAGIFLDLLYLRTGWMQIQKLAAHVQGKLSDEEADFLPESERWKVFLEARIQLAIYLAVAVWCVAIGSILPAMFIGIPTFVGAWLEIVFFGYTQHAGMREDVLDHRLNTRTVHMNPVFRFIYWNMNYHVEHHMFPMVPYHALPRLHERIKDDLPPAYPNPFVTWRDEIWPALWRQRTDPNYFIERKLPQTAAPSPVMPVAAE